MQNGLDKHETEQKEAHEDATSIFPMTADTVKRCNFEKWLGEHTC